MAKFDDALSDDRDYAFYLTMDEMLRLVLDHIEEARHAESDFLLGFHIRMTLRIMHCATELYLNWSADKLVQKEKHDEHV
jgi:hypothetical protein